MMRTPKSHHQEVEVEEEDDDDDEIVSIIPDISSSHKLKVDGKSGGDRKVNSQLRSKHSETEQRRRSKINERFQFLRDLIPQNDQKRDKASFLLEVIQYIQFLQEKIQMYEGTYQGWSPEPSKSMPWRNNCGPVESFLDQNQLVKNGSGHEDNISVNPSLLTNTLNSLESDFNEVSAFKAIDHPSGAATQAIPVDVPLQPNMFDAMPAQSPQRSFCDTEQLALESQSQFWQDRPCTTDCAVPGYAPNEEEELKPESGETTISNAYSQGLLNTLSHALQSSGVDLSQTSISVQLDIGKQTNCGPTAIKKEHENPTPSNQAMAHYGCGSSEEFSQPPKRLRTQQN